MDQPIAIVTDSTANLPAELAAALDISVIPLNVHWGGGNYKDGITLDVETFYRWLAERKDFPKTSQPSAGEFIEFFKQVAARYHTHKIMGVFISAELSGTLASAIQARAELPDLQIELLDSRSVSMGTGFLALVAARAAREGTPMEAILERVQQAQANMQVIFTVDTLEYLHRGGRIGNAARLLGTALKLKPVLTIKSGKVAALDKVRLRRKSLRRVVALAAERLAGRRPNELAIIHAQAQRELDFFTNLICKQLRPLRLHTTVLTPVVGTHGGPGSIGLVFYCRA